MVDEVVVELSPPNVTEVAVTIADVDPVEITVEVSDGVIANVSPADIENIAGIVLAALEPGVPFLLLYENAKAG